MSAQLSQAAGAAMLWLMADSAMADAVSATPFEQLQDAVLREDLPQARLLLRGLQLRGEALPVEASTGLLHQAIHVGGSARPQLVELLLSAGADPNVPAGEGATSLHMAARLGCGACVILLLRAGAWLDARNAAGETPLHAARGAVVDTLLAAGADPAARDREGNLPLHRTFHTALLVAGVDARNDAGLTPLHAAALDDAPARVRKLLAHGADPTARTTRAARWRAAATSLALGRSGPAAAGATALELAAQRQRANRWARRTHTEPMALLAPVSPAVRGGWTFWR